MKPPSTARTAGRSGGCGGACDASPLSCFFFRPRKSCEKRRKRSHTNVSSTLSTRSSTPPVQTAHVHFRSRKRVYTLGSRRKIAHSGSHGETRGVSDGGAITTLGAFCADRQPCAAGCQNGKLCRFWVLVGRCSRRTQRACGTAMRLCASLFRRRRGPAGLRDLFRFCRNCGLYIRRSWFSACARHGWYHYPRCALCAVEIPDGRLSKRLICRFLRSGGRSSPHDSYFLANTQNFLLAVPVANAFALWYDKFSKLEID